MNHFTFAFYRNLIAAVVFAPFAILFERKIRPKMSINIFLRIMLLALLEPVVDQNVYYAGMRYTTATFATAMCNLVPAITFLLAWILRLEEVKVKQLHSQGKIAGTALTIGGAMIMTLVKGHIFELPWTKHTTTPPPPHHQNHPVAAATTTTTTQQYHDHLKGAAMIAAGMFCWSCFFILQAITLKSYPACISLTALICMTGALLNLVLTLVVEHGNYSIWSLRWDTTLLAYFYNGIVCSGVVYYVSGMIMAKKGPFFVTTFNPLGMIIVASVGAILFGEQLDLGKVLGATVIIVGLYLVVWGKSKDTTTSGQSKEEDINKEFTSTKSSNNIANNKPRLDAHDDDGDRDQAVQCV
ncbi:unnamed protein product [Cuscuta campestris]|uniref:WAT1-related protein n=1 Tax=Cuscuta campestris TaxID=132261 RepID=A0A484MK37_9ASTE|nr:unnamed protein product [Cuscuta campestris]